TNILTNSKKAGWITALVSLTLFSAQLWVAVMRSDLIGLAFSLTAVWLAFTFKKDEKVSFGRLLAIILLSAAAFFTNQTFLLPAVIAALRLLQLNRWRESVLFFAGFVILVAIAMLFLNYTSAGGYVWQHFTHAKELPFSSSQLLKGVFSMLTLPTTIVFGC